VTCFKWVKSGGKNALTCETSWSKEKGSIQSHKVDKSSISGTEPKLNVLKGHIEAKVARYGNKNMITNE